MKGARVRKFMIVNGWVKCYGSMGKQLSTGDDPFIKPFITPKSEPFQDVDLDETAHKLNAIIQEAHARNLDNSRKLTYLFTGKGIVLAWENTGVTLLSEDDNTENELLAALGL
jgi:hypothetical protein